MLKVVMDVPTVCTSVEWIPGTRNIMSVSTSIIGPTNDSNCVISVRSFCLFADAMVKIWDMDMGGRLQAQRSVIDKSLFIGCQAYAHGESVIAVYQDGFEASFTLQSTAIIYAIVSLTIILDLRLDLLEYPSKWPQAIFAVATRTAPPPKTDSSICTLEFIGCYFECRTASFCNFIFKWNCWGSCAVEVIVMP